MIAIIDYGVGNLFSLKSSLEFLKQDIVVTNDEQIIRRADKLILPGVGAFKDAIDKLKVNNLDQLIIEQANKGKPLLGICLGMQMLFDYSNEYGHYKGLGLIKGDVISMKGIINDELKIPHIGWNQLHFTEKKSKLFKYIKENDAVYFVHSYFATNCYDVIATTEYSVELTAAVEKNNVYGCQFHPEKSGKIGLAILKAFCEL